MKPKKTVNKPVSRQIEVNHGNAAILAVRLLDEINITLKEIKESLKNG